MSPINKDDFLAALQKSNVLTPEALQAWLEKNPTTDGQQTALELSKAGLITRWQAKYLLSGRHVLKIGNYVLLERISQDELGDLFIANHANLDRKVQIQFLSTDLKTGTPPCNQFLQRVGKASELDHKNLVHLYDVDQEKGRYYLVTEFFAGQSLDKIASQLDSATLAQVMLQVIEALEFIHQNEMVHGGVSANDIMISADNEVKLGGIALAPLRAGNLDSPASDFEQLGQVASDAFRQLPMTEQTGRLESLIANIGSDFSSPEEIRQGLMAYLNHASQVKTVDEIPEGISLETSPQHDRSSGLQVAPASGAHPAQAANRPSPQGSNKPFLILGAAVLAGLAILGATIFIAMSLSSSSETPVAKANVDKPGTSRRAIKERDTDNELRAGVLEQNVDSPFVEKEETIPTQAPSQPPAPQTPAQAPPTDQPPAKETPAKPPAKPPADQPPPTDEPAADQPPAKETPTKPPADQPPAKPPADSTPDKPPATPPNMKPAGGNAANSANQKKPAPFANLPRHFNLPINTDGQAVSLGKIKPNPKYLLGVKLISGPEISKTKLFFELKSNHTEDTRQWDILYKTRETEPGVPVAKFVYQGNDFRFQWQPAASEDKNVNYLRNCVVKFEIGSNRDERVLRRPFRISKFKFAKDDPQVKVDPDDPDIAWLPDPKYITTELEQMDVKKYGKNFFENALITKKTPVRIAFSDIDYEQMSSILLTADIRTKIKLSATLQLHPIPGQKPKLAKPALFQSTGAALQRNANNLKQQHRQFSGTPIANLRKLPIYKSLTDPMKRQIAAQLKQEADLASEKSLKFGEQKTNSIDKFYDKVIPITISYQLGSRVIPLATTKPGQ
ncbi:MAG: protein kinase [Mariniblastus sp.]|nr:protein kinase [Mariniblastus sp.]